MSLDLIQAKLREAVDRQLPERLFVCAVGPEVPPGGFILPVGRLDMILSGCKRVVLARPGGAVELTLAAGDAYYAPPGSWELHRWDTASEMLCVVLRKEYLRVSYYRQGDPAERPGAVYHHTGRHCSEPLRQVGALLNREEAAQDPNGPARHLARALPGLAWTECEQEPLAAESGAVRLCEQVGTWLENHFQQEIDRETAAAQFGVSPSYLSRCFRMVTGAGFHDYLTRVRLDFARFLLRETELPVKRIGEQCGFFNPVHFVRRFREVEGVSPGRYRRG